MAWYQTPDYHISTFALIVILIWLQTGFAMVVLSAAIKGVPPEITEAASLDGASERQKFFRITVPMIRGSLIMVTITTAIVVLKVFDIVYVMTGGRFNTDVVANQMYLQAFQFFDEGRGSVLAVVLFLAVLPHGARQRPQHPQAGDGGMSASTDGGRLAPERSIFVRRLPLRITVIAHRGHLVAAHAGHPGELVP